MRFFDNVSAVRLQIGVGVLATVFYFGLRRCDENNRCHMTYMWRRMHFMGLDVNSTSRYSLILYGEGKYAAEFLNTGFVNGLPIVFVPGNAGSGRQIRSLGSILQNKTDSRNSTFHFDTFAVDFNEELSGLSSEYFADQAQFLAEAIQYVWNLYEKKPPGIVLIGHSMGGIVIRSLLSDATFHDKNKILMTITFASPLSEPPLYFDSGIFRIWQNLRLTHLNDHTQSLVSISGGLKDEFIDETWTYNDEIFHASAMSLDRVWLTMDHNCIVWCNQIVKHTSRLLFDYADNATDFIHQPSKLLEHHYRGSGRKLLPISQTNDIMTISECNPMCPFRDTNVALTLQESDPKNFIIVAISKEFTTDLIEVNCLGSKRKPYSIDVRHLTDDRLFAVTTIRQHLSVTEICIKMSNTSTWIFHEKRLDATSIQIRPIDLFWSRNYLLRVDHGLKVLPISLDQLFDSLVLKLSIRRYNCSDEDNNNKNHHRVVLKGGNSTLFSDIDDDGNENLYVYKLGRSQTPDIRLHFFDENICDYSLKFSVKSHYTFVRALRRYRNFIPVYLLISILLLHYYPSFKREEPSYIRIVFAAIFLLIYYRTTIESLTVISSISVTAVFILNNLLTSLEPILIYVGRSPLIQKSSPLWSILFFFPICFAAFLHSAVAGTFYGLYNLFSINAAPSGYHQLPKTFRLTLSALQCGALALQLPSVIVYVWNFHKYGYLRPLSSDYFAATNVVLFAVALTNFLYEYEYGRLQSVPLFWLWCNFVCGLSSVGGALVVYRNADFYKVLDNLSMLYALAITLLWNRSSKIGKIYQ